MLLLTVPLGIAVRFAPLHLPWFAAKYLGSMLWAAAVYWLIGALFPRARATTLFLLAFAVALAVELSRLVPDPTIDTFRATLAGRLLLGRLFSVWNIVAYTLALLLVACIDGRLQPGRAPGLVVSRNDG